MKNFLTLLTIFFFNFTIAETEVKVEQSSKYWTSTPYKELLKHQNKIPDILCLIDRPYCASQEFRIDNAKIVLFKNKASLDPVEGIWENCHLYIAKVTTVKFGCYAIQAVVKISPTKYKVYTIHDEINNSKLTKKPRTNVEKAVLRREQRERGPSLLGTIERTFVKKLNNKFFLEGKDRVEYLNKRNGIYSWIYETRDSAVFFFKKGNRIKACSKAESGSILSVDTMVSCPLDTWGKKNPDGSARTKVHWNKYPPASKFTKIWPSSGKESSIKNELKTVKNYQTKYIFFTFLFKIFPFIALFLFFYWVFHTNIKKTKIIEKKELKLHNKKYNSNFKKYSELTLYLEKKELVKEKQEQKKYEAEEKKEKLKALVEERKLEKQELAEERKQQAEQRKLEKQERYEAPQARSFDNNQSELLSKIKKLKRLYKSGALTKVEFEKAKNKLLK